ncbi:MAG: hypothetical protein ACPGVB_17685, partial [Chitinophagales bacterium]
MMPLYTTQLSNSNAIREDIPLAPFKGGINNDSNSPFEGGGGDVRVKLRQNEYSQNENTNSILDLHLKLAFEFIRHLQVWRLASRISFKSGGLNGLKIGLFFLLSFLHFNTTQAQQVFPVQVSGTIIPPYSSLLSDYSDARSQ